MKNKRLIIILSILIIILIYFLPIINEKYKLWMGQTILKNLLTKCPLPNTEGINICCYEKQKTYLCNDRDVFKCGEKIEVRIKLENINVPTYICINQTFYPEPPFKITDWTVLYNDSIFTCIVDINQKPNALITINNLPSHIYLSGIIYNVSGLKNLIEVYTFPVKNYTTIKNLFDDLNSSKTILKLEKIITC